MVHVVVELMNTACGGVFGVVHEYRMTLLGSGAACVEGWGGAGV